MYSLIIALCSIKNSKKGLVCLTNLCSFMGKPLWTIGIDEYFFARSKQCCEWWWHWSDWRVDRHPDCHLCRRRWFRLGWSRSQSQGHKDRWRAVFRWWLPAITWRVRLEQRCESVKDICWESIEEKRMPFRWFQKATVWRMAGMVMVTVLLVTEPTSEMINSSLGMTAERMSVCEVYD